MDEVDLVLLIGAVLLGFNGIFDEPCLVDFEALVVLFFGERVLDVFTVDLLYFLTNFGFDVFEESLVLFLDEDDIAFFAPSSLLVAFVIICFVLFADFSANLVEFFELAIFLV